MATMMDQKSIPNDLTRSIQVIGAGYSRTGTVSFSLALETLLKGPICHSGTASIVREEAFIKDWIKICNADPATEEANIKSTLHSLLAGYVGVTDCPALLFSGELADIYPNAIVICTTRDPERWYESFREVAETVGLWWLDILFFPMPTLRYFGAWVGGLTQRHKLIYGHEGKITGSNHLIRHEEYLKRVVPQERLFFFNVKDGWAPLCQILDLPIPEAPFPHANDKVAIQEFFVGLFKDSIVRWGQIIGVLGVAVASAFWVAKR